MSRRFSRRRVRLEAPAGYSRCLPGAFFCAIVDAPGKSANAARRPCLDHGPRPYSTPIKEASTSTRIMERVWESSLGPSRKLVALSYANSAHDEDNRAWASLAYLERRTGLDRKTIIAAITALEAAGILTDTGDRRGKTNSIKVYAVAVPETELHSSTETGEKQSQNSQEAVPFFPGSSTENGTQRRTGDVPETNRKPSARLNGERQELETRFARFWEVYPRKVAKVAAFRAWMKLTPGDAQLEDMLADVLDRCRSPDWLKDNGAYIPHPATYLNGKRWEDCVTDLKGKP